MLVASASGALEGDWLIADRQTAGRGRIGREWQSPLGNVYASGLVRVRPGEPNAATLALVAAVAIFDTIAMWAAVDTLTLKWPNDLLVNGAKLSGILLERAGDAIVVGFGVNLVAYPDGLGKPVTCLASSGSHPPAPNIFVEALADIFSRWVAVWRGEGLTAIRQAWLARAHAVGTALIVNAPDGDVIEGLFDGLTDDCALRLRLADGAVRVIHAGDVFLI
jgi:BirA family transcriptional regulator, biotin operon repressor / biotin---[acetyl-CoA-carboxylase] ligase